MNSNQITNELHEEPATAVLGSAVVRRGTSAALVLLSSQAISFVGVIILARFAPPATFGAYAAAAILIGWGTLLTESGMQAALVQREKQLQGAASTALVVNLLSGLALGLIGAAAAPLVGLFFDSREIGLAAAALAGTVPIIATSIVPGAMLQRRLSLLRIAVEPFSAATYVVTSIATLAAGLGIWGLVAGTYAAAVARTVALWLLVGWRPSLGLVSWDMYRQLVRYGRSVLAGETLREFGRVGNIAVVGRILGIGSLGEYRYALQLVTQTSLSIVFGSAYVLLPAFSRIWRDEQRFRQALFRAMRLLSLIVFPLSFAFIPLGNAFAVVLFGPPWRGAGPIMMALAGVGIAYMIDSICSEVFKARGRPEFLPRMHGLTATVPILLIVGLVHVMGSAGAGLGMSIGTTIVAVYALSRMGRISGIRLRDLLKQLRPALVGATVMAALLFILEHAVLHADRGGAAGLGLLLLEVLIGIALYVGALRVVAREALRELIVVTQAVFLGSDRRAAVSTDEP